jgi:peptidoglycan/xylan/chitin deacetylase (PgdA/CDA1 family)
MKLVVALLSVVLAFVVVLRTPALATPERRIAITIDDLPAASASSMNAATITAMTKQLLATLREQKIPVVGFVNERKLYFHWDEVNERIAALNMWLEAGFELGNHTYGHTSLNRAGLRSLRTR